LPQYSFDAGILSSLTLAAHRIPRVVNHCYGLPDIKTNLANPLNDDTDGDGLLDGFEDPDGDGLNNIGEQSAGATQRTGWHYQYR
jgi:hypothetical protein